VTRGACVVAIVFVRACVAATLGYAFWPAPAFVVIAALFDAGVGLLVGARALSGRPPPRALVHVEVGARLAILIALRQGWLGGPSPDLLGSPEWVMGYLGSLLLWFSPIAVGRLAVVLILDAWRTPDLHGDERARRGDLAIGVTLVVLAICEARLVRVAAISIALGLTGAVGLAFIASAAWKTVRRRRFLARVQRGDLATHRLIPVEEANPRFPLLDDSVDAVLVTSRDGSAFRSGVETVAGVRTRRRRTSMEARRVLPFAIIAWMVTLGFDGACWHGSGWIVVRRDNGDNLMRPRYLRAHRVLEWPTARRHRGTVYWEVENERFEPHGAWFARVSGELDPISLVINVPEGTCARPFFVRRRDPMPGNSAHSVDERSRIVEPMKRDGRLIYTSRDLDGRLVRVDLALNGKSAICTVDPAPVDDGGASSRLVGTTGITAGRAHTCVFTTKDVECWGRITGSAGPAQSIPEFVGGSPRTTVTGDGFVCDVAAGGASCSGGDEAAAPFRDVPSGASGATLTTHGNNGAIRVFEPNESPEVQFFHAARFVTLARDRACFLRDSSLIRCIGPSAPPLEGIAATRVAVGSSLACYLRAEGDVWCAEEMDRPTKVEGLPRATTIDVGESHACAVAEDSTVWCWGRNADGALGDGTTIDRPKPVRVLDDAIAIATGARHSCAIGRDTKVRCWGANADGQLGDGTFVNRHMPVEVVW